ncbi:hypothetical protein MLD38_019793 [Melastoma candidum]|uniref:Uncharacterized protein n=1 Tax=Melastoma candidum TaxID=119954 RepID=A0ACB9QBG7_9MYRT|nr:hypothetical protein MLD38_019793 [Melastoma candidum]
MAHLMRPGTSAVAGAPPPCCTEEEIPIYPEFGGGGKLIIPPTLEDYGVSRWQHTLVGYLLGKAAPYPVLRKICMQLWQRKDLVEVGTMSKGAIILRFDTEQYIDEIVDRADWHLAGCPLLLRRWQPGVAINEEPTALPCWMRLSGIPLELWHKRGVHYLASSVGQLLKTDARSFNSINMGTARVQVECAAKNGFSKTIEAIDSRGNTFTVSIHYETRALCCKECGVFGHDEACCSKGHAQPANAKAAPLVNPNGTHQVLRKQSRRRRRKPVVLRPNKGKNLLHAPRQPDLVNIVVQPGPVVQKTDDNCLSPESAEGNLREAYEDGEFVPESVIQNSDLEDQDWEMPGKQELSRMDRLIEQLRSKGRQFEEDERGPSPRKVDWKGNWDNAQEAFSNSSGSTRTIIEGDKRKHSQRCGRGDSPPPNPTQ